jgi:hypothetical protein
MSLCNAAYEVYVLFWTDLLISKEAAHKDSFFSSMYFLNYAENDESLRLFSNAYCYTVFFSRSKWLNSVTLE